MLRCEPRIVRVWTFQNIQDASQRKANTREHGGTDPCGAAYTTASPSPREREKRAADTLRESKFAEETPAFASAFPSRVRSNTFRAFLLEPFLIR
jgi:hypothetical protein